MTAIHPELSPKSRYWIDRHRYYELKHFCLQYPLWIRARASLDGLSRRALRLTPPSPSGLVQSPTSRCAEQRLWYTERIAMVEDEESRLSIEEELIDRFGDIPEPVENLIRIAQLRGVTRKLGVSHLSLRPDGVHLRLDERHMPEPDQLFEAITKADGRLRFAVGKKPELVLCERNLSPEAAVDMAIRVMTKVHEELSALREKQKELPAPEKA